MICVPDGGGSDGVWFLFMTTTFLDHYNISFTILQHKFIAPVNVFLRNQMSTLTLFIQG